MAVASTREPSAYLAKARQNAAAAQAACAARQFDVAASRAYYAAFQAAVAALWVEGIRPPQEATGTLSHTAVRGEWSGRLVYRRKLYPAELRDTLHVLYKLRVKGDYQAVAVTEREARRACLRAQQLLQAVAARLQADA